MNGTESPSVMQRVVAHAERTPHAVALVQGDRHLTYAELLCEAARLAGRMRRAGAVAGSRIGINLDRGPEAIIAMLASWWVGAAYVPLPVDYPNHRLRFMLVDSDARLVVTGPTGATFEHGVPELRPDAGAEVSPAPPERTPLHPDGTAYLIYTSGSTGDPKGVAVSHRGIANLVRPCQRYVRFSPEETFLLLAPLAFDASAFEIWGALGNGARLVIAAPSYRGLDELQNVLRANGVTTLLLTPPLFHALMASRPEVLDPLRCLIVGGEAMSARVANDFAERARQQGSSRVLHNVYGPTEATTLVTWHPMETVPADADHLPLGRPLAGVTVHLLDEALRPVTVEGTGEVYIGGDAVALGYHNRPGLTADRFRPDPFAAVAGARMYATGDIGRLGVDGLIRFLGRVDDQVKVRGHRVELAEIEHVLSRHPDVEQACVVVAGESGDLVAHLVMRQPEVDLSDLEKHAATFLPTYMVPARFVRHETLALTQSGKIDRRALAAAPTDAVPTDSTSGSGPVTTGVNGSASPLGGLSGPERVLGAIWADVLQVAEVGPDDDFFVVGGDSLSAIRIVGEAEDRGLRVTIESLFRNRTIRAICAALAADTSATERHSPHPSRMYHATRLQLGLIYESEMSGGEHYVDVVSREVALPFDESALRRSLEWLQARHELLRARFDLGSYDEAMVVVENDVTPLLTVSFNAGAERVVSRMRAPFDVNAAPLIRFHADVLALNRFQLTYGFHHAIMDGWSESVLALELVQMYTEALHGGSSQLPAPPSYEDFVRLEQQALAIPDAARYFADLPVHNPGSTRPARRRPGTEAPHIDRAIVTGAELMAVRGHARRWRLPMKSMLFAATGRALTGLRGRDGVQLWMSVSGRPELPEADRMVGLFLNWIPVRFTSGDGSWAGQARRAFEAEAAMLPVRRYPFVELKNLVGDHEPIEIAFNYLRFRLADRLRDLGVTVTRQDVYDRTSLPVLVEFHDEPDSLALDVRADSTRYDATFVQVVSAQIRRALRELGGGPNLADDDPD